MAEFFRWNISRVYQGGGLAEDGSRYVEVVITPQARDLLDAADVVDLPGLMNVTRDRLQWWQSDEEQQLEGRLTENQFFEAISTRTLLSEPMSTKAVWQQRRLEEDMVFLQCVDDERGLEEALAELQTIDSRPDLTVLLDIDGAYWLDFTQQARKMAATHYRRALGEQGEEKDA